METKKAQSNHKTRTPTQENKFNLLLKTIRNHRPSQVRKPQIRLQTLITVQTNNVQIEQGRSSYHALPYHMRDGGKTKRRENTKTLRKIQKWKEIDTLESRWKQRIMEKTNGSKEKQLRNSIWSLVQLEMEATARRHSSKVSLDGVVEKRKEKNEKKQGK